MKRPHGMPKVEWRRMRAASAIEFRAPAYPMDQEIPRLLAISAACDARCLAALGRMDAAFGSEI